MSDSMNLPRADGSDVELAEMIVQVAEATQVKTIVCATENSVFAQHLQSLSDQFRVIVATTSRDATLALSEAGLEVMRLPMQTADKYHQARHVLSVALRTTRVSAGDLVVCAIASDLYPQEGRLIVVADVEPNLEHLSVIELLKLTDGIRPKAMEAAITVACRIGLAARRGRRVGAIFMLGDSLKVLEDSRQLIPNPFHGHDEVTRQLANSDNHDFFVELSKLDGAFVVRGDGFIQTAGTFLAAPHVDLGLPTGLGARHVAAASVTARTTATAVVVSATDGNVRVFSEGVLTLQVDPEVAHGPIKIDG